MTPIDEIKARLDIVDLVSETVQLRHSGKNYTGFCPFHPNTRTPSFVVFPETQTWRCFGQCNEGGDIFKFVMKKEGWDFPEALRNLARRAGVTLRAPTPQERERDEEHDRLRELLEEAVTFYRHQLLNTPNGQATLDYLHQRGLRDETIENFGLGYAPDEWEAALNYFLEKGYSMEEMLAAGLIAARGERSVAEREEGGHYDRFRHRVMFPIRDPRGRMVGFGARALRADERAKYLNSPQTALFDKSHLLYGLDMARKAIRSEDQVVIVEGYLDVIALHQAGYKNSVSPMGTALTDHQLRLLKPLTRRMVLALDPDVAGVQATLRGLQVARETLDREADPTFDARGLLRHEARLQADIRVTTLPEDKDPDEIVNENPEEWVRILGEARPIVAHVMDTLAAGEDLNDPKVKTDIAAQVLPLIQDLPDPLERDTYVQRLARLLRVDERSLLVEGRPRRRGRPVRRMASAQPPTSEEGTQTRPLLVSPSRKLEEHCLGIIMRQPELLNRVNRALQEAGLERLAKNDFQDSDHQEMFHLALESINQDAEEPVSFALVNLPLPLLDAADLILLGTEKLDPNEERVLEDLLRTILFMRKTDLHQRNEELRYLQQTAQEEGDVKASQFQQAMLNITSTLNQLDQAIGKYTDHTVLTR